MVVSQTNQYNYFVAAHAFGLASKGLDDEAILNVRRGRGTASDARHSALIDFTVKVLDAKGLIGDGDLEAFKRAGLTDAHPAEITVMIAQQTLSNLFNRINDTDLDLPEAPAV